MTSNLILLAVFAVTPAITLAQSTAFTYQGRLNHAGSPATGLYEMGFALYDSVTNGSLVASPISFAPVPVTNGLFTAVLDFGSDAFGGSNRWLESPSLPSVRTNRSSPSSRGNQLPRPPPLCTRTLRATSRRQAPRHSKSASPAIVLSDLKATQPARMSSAVHLVIMSLPASSEP